MKLFFSLPKRLRSLVASVTLEKGDFPKGLPALDLAAQAIEKLHQIGLAALAKRLHVLWNPRMRSTAGLAYPDLATIVLNPKLKEFGNEEVERTLFHELAHLVAQHRVGKRRIAPHGSEWQRACVDLGIQNETRCHDLPLPRRKVTIKHIYLCPNCKTQLERVRPFRRAAACLGCCKKFAKGSYDPRFKLIRLPVPPKTPTTPKRQPPEAA
jgi:SprT protein